MADLRCLIPERLRSAVFFRTYFYYIAHLYKLMCVVYFFDINLESLNGECC